MPGVDGELRYTVSDEGFGLSTSGELHGGTGGLGGAVLGVAGGRGGQAGVPSPGGVRGRGGRGGASGAIRGGNGGRAGFPSGRGGAGGSARGADAVQNGVVTRDGPPRTQPDRLAILARLREDVRAWYAEHMR